MATKTREQNPNNEKSEDLIDESVEETFPRATRPPPAALHASRQDDDKEAGDGSEANNVA